MPFEFEPCWLELEHIVQNSDWDMIVVGTQRGSDKTDSGVQKAITKDVITNKYNRLRLGLFTYINSMLYI